MPRKNYYDILGIDPATSPKEIRTSYLMRSRVLHPDRFDPKTQHQEWRKANEMLAELNEAYSTLRDPRKRAQYDVSMGFGQASAETNYSHANSGTDPARPTSEPHTDNRTSTTNQLRLGVTHLRFADLPSSSQKKLLDRQNGKGGEQFKLKTGNYVAPFFSSLLAIAWLAILMEVSVDYRWSSPDALGLYTGLTIVSTVALWWAIKTFYLWRTAELTPHIYLTPLYFIKTKFDEVSFWWLWGVKDYKVTHKYSNGTYTHTMISLIFEDGTESFILKGQSRVKSLWNTLGQWESRYKQALAERDMDYFLNRDDFIEVRETRESQSNTAERSSHKQTYKKYFGYAGAIVAGIGIVVFAHNMNLYFDDKKSWESARLLDNAAAYRTYLQTHAAGRWKAEADIRVTALYDASAKRYLNSRSSRFDTRASDSVIDLLNYAKATQNYSVSIAFLRHNQIPSNVEEQLKRTFEVTNILSMGDSFSDKNMQSRENRILDAIKAAFKVVIPEDILEFKDSQFKENGAAFLVAYTVSAGESLYYHDEDSNMPKYSRPFYPGIFIDWNFEIRLPSKGSSYQFTLKSQPASRFSSSVSAVYDAMAQSAFDDFKSELVRRLGLRSGNEAGASPNPSQRPAPLVASSLIKVRLRLLSQGALHYSALEGYMVALTVGAKTFEEKTGNDGWVTFHDVPCGEIVNITSQDFELQNGTTWQVKRRLQCSKDTAILGSFGDLSGEQLSKDDLQYILK
jgi:hypothetical protein